MSGTIFSHGWQSGNTWLEGNRPWQQAGSTPCSPCLPCIPCTDLITVVAELVDAVQFDGPPVPSVALAIMSTEQLGRDGLADWEEVQSHRDLVLHPATIAAMQDAIANGFIAIAHQLQGAARWVIFLDGSHLALGSEGPSASWAFVVLVRIRGMFQLVCVRSGIVCLDPASPAYMGANRTTNNTGETEAFGHALLWALTLKGEPGQLLLVAERKYAIKAAQALQRCNSNVALVHTVRRIWRAVAAEREVVAEHTKGHSEDPWNEFSDVLADYVHSGGTFPGEHGILPQWYTALGALRDAPNLALPCTALPFFMPLSRSTKPLEAPRRRKNAAQRRRFASFNALTPFSGGCTTRRRADGTCAAGATCQGFPGSWV